MPTPSSQRPNNSSRPPRAQQSPQQRSTVPRSKRKRTVRYDRLLILGLILLVLILILVHCARSCGSSSDSQDSGGNSAPTATEEKDTQSSEEPSEDGTLDDSADYSHAVYLSPSNQADKLYADGTTKESDVMREIANQTAALLEADGYTVIIAGETDSLPDKLTAAQKGGFAAYVALHSDAGTDTGTEGYYNDAVTDSYALTDCVYSAVAAVTPTEDRGMLDGSIPEDSHYLYEVGQNTVPSCAIYLDSHADATTAQWILSNESELAQALASGISNYMKSLEGGAGNGSTDSTDSQAELSTDAGEDSGAAGAY